MKQPLTEILDAKSAGKVEFQLAICKDDWMKIQELHEWLKEVESWCNLNSFSAKHIKATDPVIVDGKSHSNPMRKVTIVEFTKLTRKT